MEIQTLRNLIRYIIFEIQDSGGFVLRTRLVKLLYLCDIEYFRSHRKKMTPLQWRRYIYGPFSFELQSITKSIGFDLSEEGVDFSSKKGVKYEAYEPQEIDKILSPSEKAIVDRVINRWGQEDLSEILDYVYCQTEPMFNAQMGEILDFRKISRGVRFSISTSLEIGDENIQRIKALKQKQMLVSREPIPLKIFQRKSTQENEEVLSIKIQGRSSLQNKEEIFMFEGIE